MGSSKGRPQLRITLREYLDSKQITAYALAQWVDGFSKATIYAIAAGHRRPSLDALEAILFAFTKHGYPVSLGDLVEYDAPDTDDASTGMTA